MWCRVVRPYIWHLFLGPILAFCVSRVLKISKIDYGILLVEIPTFNGCPKWLPHLCLKINAKIWRGYFPILIYFEINSSEEKN